MANLTSYNFFEKNKNKYQNKSKFTKSVLNFLKYLFVLLLSFGLVYGRYYYSLVYGTTPPLLILFISILISGLIGGGYTAIFSLIISIIFSFYFFYSSYSSLSLSNANIILLIIFTIEGIFTALIFEMKDRSEKNLHNRINQQFVITQLGQYALNTNSLNQLFNKTAQLITETLNVRYCKILELQNGKKSFLLKGGIGWKPGLVGHSLLTARNNSQEGYTLLNNKPVIVTDLRSEKRFYPPELLTSHGVVSSVNVIIPSKKGIYGILGVHSMKKRNFTKDDIYFIQAIANILASAIEKNLADKQLKDSELKFKKLFDSNIIGAFISDFEGVLIEANDALLRLIEYTKEDLKQGKIKRDILTDPKDDYLSIKAVNDLKTKGSSDIYEKTYITKTGKKIPVLIAVSRIDLKSNLCVGFVLDMSKQKESENRKDYFISIASHELKTPVTSLKILTQFLKQKFKMASKNDSVKYFDKMDRQVDKLTILINDLLDITKIQAGKLELHKEIFNMNDLITEIVEDTQELTNDHKILIKGNIKEAILADRDRIGQVVTNLLTNAIKYSPKNSDVVVNINKDNTNVLISVQDFGVGIEKKYQRNIFEQFFRINTDVDHTYPGLGLGLYISSQIVQRHNGEIGVNSSKDNGSTFYFKLPIPNNLYEQ